jgi:hypothetical protein
MGLPVPELVPVPVLRCPVPVLVICVFGYLQYMLIPICAQFHYAYGDSPYANFSGSPHVRIWGLPVCVRGSVSDVSSLSSSHALNQNFYMRRAMNQNFANAQHAHATSKTWNPRMHTGIKFNPRMHTGIACHAIPVSIQGSKSIPVCIRRS